MTTPTIKDISGRRILDSRGLWTLEVELRLSDGSRAWASVPQGKSIGSYEAVCVDERDALRALEAVIEPAVRGFRAGDQQGFDERLIALDGTTRKERLGANTTLALSWAYARASAISQGKHLWEYLAELADTEPDFPQLYANLINGGLHAPNDLDIQEYLVIPRERDPEKATDIVLKMYHALREVLVAQKGACGGLVGDEGGFAPDFRDNLEPLQFFALVAREVGVEQSVSFGLDIAANSLFMEEDELNHLIDEACDTYPVNYLEDPFREDAFEAFAALTQRRGGQARIAGDDLTTTNLERMKRAHKERSINTMIVKPNQIGTVTETLEAIEHARAYGWQVIVSHRSGETTDDAIADLAFAVGADGIKLGAPARGERTAKYNRLLLLARQFQKKD
ncbi:MAG: enolase [Candidatus Parcubacteria bacterium]|nr:MAG: enolase [Candidatus Parcubacteria bacterium]